MSRCENNKYTYFSLPFKITLFDDWRLGAWLQGIGKVFPGGSAAAAGDELFNSLALNVVDFDNGGLLDLWLSGYGERAVAADETLIELHR